MKDMKKSELNPESLLRIFFYPKWKDVLVARRRFQKVKARLKPYYKAAVEGKLDKWKSTLKGKFALILIYDQAPRLVFRGFKRYSTDRKARNITKQLWESKEYRNLPLQQQMFAFFPYHHAENLELQRISKKAFSDLYKKDPQQFSWIYKASSVYSMIIKKFGIFPQRSKDLGRKTTKEEKIFLKKEFPRLVAWVWKK